MFMSFFKKVKPKPKQSKKLPIPSVPKPINKPPTTNNQATNAVQTTQALTTNTSKEDNLPLPLNHIKHIPIETIIDLHAKNLSHAQIAKIVGCRSQNITQRLQASGITSLRNFKKNRADVFATIQSRILNSIGDDDIKKAPFGSRITAAAILYDKERLERDKSTSNVLSIHSDIAALKGGKDA